MLKECESLVKQSLRKLNFSSSNFLKLEIINEKGNVNEMEWKKKLKRNCFADRPITFLYLMWYDIHVTCEHVKWFVSISTG